MLKLKPVSSVLAALMIASALSGCGGGGVEPVSKTGGDAQITAAAVEAKAKAAAVAKAKAAAVAKAKAAAAAKAKAAAAAKAKAAAAAKAKAAAAAAAATAAEEAAAAAEEAPPPETSVYYENCTAVRAAGADPIYRGEPGYSSKLDRDGDGIACE
jgi:hypothetical protein